MKRSQLTITLSMLAVFLSGSVVGAFAHRLYMVRTVSTADTTPQRRSPSEFRQRYLNELKLRVGLDDTQTSAVNEILDRTRARFHDFNEKHKTELSSIQFAQVSEIEAILSAEQRPRYQAFLAEREQKRREREKEAKK